MHRKLAGLLMQLASLMLLAVVPAAASAAGVNWSTPKLVDSQPQYTNRLEAAACPSASLCVLGDNSGHVLTSTDALAGSWTTPQATGGHFNDLSCPASSFCAGVGLGSVNISTDPAGGSAAWTATEIDPTYPSLLGISCASSSLCVAVDEAGHILSSTDPSGGSGAWTLAGPVGGVGRLFGVSCPTESLCVAVGTNGTVLTSTNPSGGAGAWTATQIEPLGAGLFGVSCASASFCVAAGGNGTITTSTDPAGGSWSVAHIGSDESLGGALGRVSCPSASFCAVSNFGGHVATSTNPSGGPGAWTVSNVDPGMAVLSMSCVSEALCVAGDAVGKVLVGSDSLPPQEEPKEEPREEQQPAPSGGDGQGGGSPSPIAPQASAPTSSPQPAPAPLPNPVTTGPKSKPLKCHKGFKKQKAHGKHRCVKIKRKRHQGQSS